MITPPHWPISIIEKTIQENKDDWHNIYSHDIWYGNNEVIEFSKGNRDYIAGYKPDYSGYIETPIILPKYYSKKIINNDIIITCYDYEHYSERWKKHVWICNDTTGLQFISMVKHPNELFNIFWHIREYIYRSLQWLLYYRRYIYDIPKYIQNIIQFIKQIGNVTVLMKPYKLNSKKPCNIYIKEFKMDPEVSPKYTQNNKNHAFVNIYTDFKRFLTRVDITGPRPLTPEEVLFILSEDDDENDRDPYDYRREDIFNWAIDIREYKQNGRKRKIRQWDFAKRIWNNDHPASKI